MSKDLLKSYERDYKACIKTLRDIIEDPIACERTFKQAKGNNPYEYEQANNFLKQMEIESMNFGDDSAEGDQVRKLIQQHKREFDKVRREMRNAQQAYENDVFRQSERSTDDQELADLEQRTTNKLMRQRMQLEEAKEVGYACEDMATDIKINLQGQHQ